MPDMTWRSMRAASALLVRRQIELTVDGLENVPSTGPVIIAARHFHHLYDGCVLLATVPRPLSILVALDWVHQPLGKRAMAVLCGAAQWPVVQRRVQDDASHAGVIGRGLRQATRESLALLADGRVLVVFPEGYPNIDPGYTPKQDDATFLPFEPGFIRLAMIATARGWAVPIVPAGFAYQRGSRWRVRLAFGDAILLGDRAHAQPALHRIEAIVRELSQWP